MTTLTPVERMAETARMWQRRADDETGKRRSNGWTSRELQASDIRFEVAIAKRDAAWREHDRLVDLESDPNEDLHMMGL